MDLSKVVRRVALAAGLPRFSTHTTRPAATARPTRAPASSWPLDLGRYDRRTLLSDAETETLRHLDLGQLRRDGLAPGAAALRPAARLIRPMANAIAVLHLAA